MYPLLVRDYFLGELYVQLCGHLCMDGISVSNREDWCIHILYDNLEQWRLSVICCYFKNAEKPNQHYLAADSDVPAVEFPSSMWTYQKTCSLCIILHNHKVTWTKINLGTMFTVIDSLSVASSKSVQADFHTAIKWIWKSFWKIAQTSKV